MTDALGREYRTLSTEIANALAEQTETVIGNRITLRDAVCEYLSVEIARGTALKFVIEAVKHILKQAEAAVGASEVTKGRSDELALQLVDWCVEFHGKNKLARV